MYINPPVQDVHRAIAMYAKTEISIFVGTKIEWFKLRSQVK